MTMKEVTKKLINYIYIYIYILIALQTQQSHAHHFKLNVHPQILVGGGGNRKGKM